MCIFCLSHARTLTYFHFGFYLETGRGGLFPRSAASQKKLMIYYLDERWKVRRLAHPPLVVSATRRRQPNCDVPPAPSRKPNSIRCHLTKVVPLLLAVFLVLPAIIVQSVSKPLRKRGDPGGSPSAPSNGGLAVLLVV